ncbi:hypothetical protein Tco_1234753 [Tanacetum coccineum]
MGNRCLVRAQGALDEFPLEGTCLVRASVSMMNSFGRQCYEILHFIFISISTAALNKLDIKSLLGPLDGGDDVCGGARVARAWRGIAEEDEGGGGIVVFGWSGVAGVETNGGDGRR